MKSIAVLECFCFFFASVVAVNRLRSTLSSTTESHNFLDSKDSELHIKASSFKPGSAAQPFDLWTLRKGMVKYPSDAFPNGVPVGLHAFSNESAFLECMWTSSDSLADFVKTAPIDARYVFMTFEKNAVDVVTRMESTLNNALDNSNLSQVDQETFRKHSYFVVTPVDEMGNWITSLLNAWSCSGHGCGYDQILFHSEQWFPQVNTIKRLDARYDWAFNHQWTPKTATLSPVTNPCISDNLGAFKNGTVAVISASETGCSIGTSVANLQEAGAVGVIAYSMNGEPVKELNCIGDECNTMINIPVMSIDFNQKLIDALNKGKDDVTATLQTTPSPNFYFTIDSNGNLAEAGWFLYPSLQFLAWQMQWLEYVRALQNNISSLNDYVVPVFNNTKMQGKNGTGYTVLELKDLHLYESLYLDMHLGCPGDMDEDCPPWDHTPTLYVSCNKSSSSMVEIGRWITAFRRRIGHWLTDITPLLPVLASSQDTSQCTFLLKMSSWWAQPWLATLNLRFVRKPHSFSVVGGWSNNLAVLYPYTVLPLFQGGTFDKTYNQKYKPYPLKVPSGTKQVKIYAVITGHGSDNNNCAEFCVTSHHFTVNNKTYIKTFSNAGTPLGCAERVPQGVVPNEHGTWLYGRDGWCDGQQVDPWIFDITSDLSMTSTNSISYQGLFNGHDPSPTQNPGIIDMVSYVVFYH